MEYEYDIETDLEILTEIESGIDIPFLDVLTKDRANLIIMRALLLRIKELEDKNGAK